MISKSARKFEDIAERTGRNYFLKRRALLKNNLFFNKEKRQKNESTSNFQQAFPQTVEKEMSTWETSLRFFHFSHELIADAVDFVLEGAVLRHFVFDDIDGGENRRMVPAENFRCILKRNIGDAPNDINGDMARERDLIGSFFAFDVLDGDVVAFRYALDDLFGDKCRRHCSGDHAGEDLQCRP